MFHLALASFILAATANIDFHPGDMFADDDTCDGECVLKLLQVKGLQTQNGTSNILHNEKTNLTFADLGEAWSKIHTLDKYQFYGRLEIKSLTKPGYCLSADGNRIGNGVRLIMWECVGSIGQQWDIKNYGGLETRIELSEDPSYCVSVDGNHFRDGFKLQLWKCVDDRQNFMTWQPWPSDGNLISPKSDQNMCMVVDNNNVHNGARVIMWTCNTEDPDQQMWIPAGDELGLE